MIMQQAVFASIEFKTYLMKRGIASSQSSIYYPAGNGQEERTVGTIWRAVFSFAAFITQIL